MSGFYHKHFLKLLDFTPAELNSLLQLAAKLKANKKSGKEEAKLTGKNIALIFEKELHLYPMLFLVAAYDQGARVTYLGPSGSQIGHKESIKDTARVLGRMYDGIQYRGYGQEIVETLADYAGVPVWNGLTNEFHPAMELLADLLTMQEHLPGKAFNEMTLVYAGDARNNMAIRCSKLRRLPVWICVWSHHRHVAGSCAGYGMPRPGTAKWREYYAHGRCSQRS
ncbi:hypothetical protein ACLB1R_30845 [Escherichia coli]